MKEFILFNRSNFASQEEFDSHLNELQKYGGSPDCYSIHNDLVRCMEMAKTLNSEGKRTCVITDEDYNIIDTLDKQNHTYKEIFQKTKDAETSNRIISDLENIL